MSKSCGRVTFGIFFGWMISVDYFDMGNDVDRNDPAAVAEEKEIAKLHKSIDHGLYAAPASGSLSEALKKT